MLNENLDSAFLEAAGRCSLSAMQSLLTAGADVNARSATGQTALMRVVRRGRKRAPALIRWLLARSSAVTAADRHDRTALHIAAQGEDLETIGLLLDAGADPNAMVRYRYGYRPPIWYAIQQRSLPVTRLLLDRGADPDARSVDRPMLYWATREDRDPEIVRCLLDHGADPNAVWERDWTPLYLAAYEGDLELVQLLLRYGASPNAQVSGGLSAKPLWGAVLSTKTAIIQTLLDHGADPNLMVDSANAFYPLSSAVYGNDVVNVRLLLAAGADPRPALDVAAEMGWTEIERLLREAAGDAAD